MSVYPVNSQVGRPGANSLADVLERVLDKGVVIAGDIKVNILDIELLTLRVRLLIASADTAREMGINWWQGDPFLGSGQPEQVGGTDDIRQLEADNESLRARVDRLERALEDRRASLPEGGDAQ